ncbi:hypothetical protein PHLGIDRAFT_349364 [Phlebiopsis gigantea 11061_1 CR5-6]|uniref:D-isomer specific 2-hydroxyacid dehydrogenase NAD-binding domain-containing protein n=1 Tax=Phlebiopsis gigantea (strain 11061_1 CR5-6) TaxID=745531 RepID=A0A0C3P9W8_PHLG1|nr:hypothetical protein PHLGIDRAFT_349364 [Phlebiopsis gigantea 11061_1 CR5-6]
MGPGLSTPPFSHLLVASWNFPPAHRTRLAPYFANITHVPLGGTPTDAQLAEADVIFGLPRATHVRSIHQVPKLRFIQLGSAGSDGLIGSPMWEEQESEREREKWVKLASCSGVHVGAIGQYFVMTTLALFHRLQGQILISQNEKRWGSDSEISGSWIFIEELRHKTVGVLGYGHIGRESSRLASAFGARILAANSSGTRQPLGGYIIPGTGDPDGTIPEMWYSTSDRESLKAFLEQSDVLLLSLPSTPATRRILNQETLGWLKSSAVLVNVGRGDAIDTDALVQALDQGKLAGAALDVVEPEPLPAGHPLFGRKNVIITPHLSGRSVRYPELALDVLITNLDKLVAGEKLVNEVDPRKGY